MRFRNQFHATGLRGWMRGGGQGFGRGRGRGPCARFFADQFASQAEAAPQPQGTPEQQLAFLRTMEAELKAQLASIREEITTLAASLA
jgi:hypothetical protein